MTVLETKKVLSIVQSMWPHFMDGRDSRTVINVWMMLFTQETEPQVEAAIMAFAASDTKGYPPTPGALKEIISRSSASGEDITEQEAWNIVMRALHNGIYGYEDEYAKMPESIQRTLGDPKVLREWAMLDADQVQTVIASNFQRSYRARSSAMRDYAKIPPEIRARLSGLIPALAPKEPEALHD